MIASGGMNIRSKEADEYANRMYEQFRRRRTDCVNVSRNSGFTIEQVTVIKNYLFKDCHDLSYGYEPFLPCYEIAESWRRLSENSGKNIQPHDLLLLQHEMYEIILVIKDRLSQSRAHDIASKHFDYQKASEDFYKRNGQF